MYAYYEKNVEYTNTIQTFASNSPIDIAHALKVRETVSFVTKTTDSCTSFDQDLILNIPFQ